MSAPPVEQPNSAHERREGLKELYRCTLECTRCPELAAMRKSVVFGAGNADADLMFIGEAPGASEDEQGLPFVGQAGKLLDKLLEEIGLQRQDVFIANVLKCLSYDARVQLGDGSWERIGRLVRSSYDGEVMSVDEDGSLVPKRVIGWHATPLAGRSVYRLTYRSCEQEGESAAGIELTGDHPVLTERGYLPVAELAPNDRIATGQGLSQLAWDVVCGTVLGGASLPESTSALTLDHWQEQAQYARFTAQLLAELSAEVHEHEVAAAAGEDRVHSVVHLRTPAHRALRILRRDFYQPHKVVPQWLAEQLNPRMLAFWFMDRGSTRMGAGERRPLAEIAAVSFSDADLQVLMRGLQRLGLAAKATRKRLYFDAAATERLSDMIAPFVPPSMRYKLHPDAAARIAFDPGRLEPGPIRSLYDEVRVEQATTGERVDVSFFCIDVEDTHNFVTAGGVVHNCRPPGNRDPQPGEIENCREYLYRQVELIEPRVICTLGNFSTKLLRGDPTGITRLHGQPEVITLGRRAVRIYPIYHPAAALYTPRMLETLREDFARLPQLLTEPPPEQPELIELPDVPDVAEVSQPDQAAVEGAAAAPIEHDQLGLF